MRCFEHKSRTGSFLQIGFHICEVKFYSLWEDIWSLKPIHAYGFFPVNAQYFEISAVMKWCRLSCSPAVCVQGRENEGCVLWLLVLDWEVCGEREKNEWIIGKGKDHKYFFLFLDYFDLILFPVFYLRFIVSIDNSIHVIRKHFFTYISYLSLFHVTLILICYHDC